MKLTDGKIRVEWVDLGEGMSGDYNEDDPNDTPLLRFDVLVQTEMGEWEFPPKDSSFCTLMPVGTDKQILSLALHKILDSVKEKGCGRNLQELSWMEPSWFTA